MGRGGLGPASIEAGGPARRGTEVLAWLEKVRKSDWKTWESRGVSNNV